MKLPKWSWEINDFNPKISIGSRYEGLKYKKISTFGEEACRQAGVNEVTDFNVV